MTTEGTDQLEPGPELNRLMAERVMGWKLVNYNGGEPAKTPADYEDAAVNDGWKWEGREGDHEAWDWHPSAVIADAMEVVEAMKSKGFAVGLWDAPPHSLVARPWVAFRRGVFPPDRRGEADGVAVGGSMPLAVCRAALRALAAGVR